MSRERFGRSLTPSLACFFGLTLAAAFFLALLPIFPRQLQVDEGDVASRTIRSPRAVTFESELLTEQRREEAARAVAPLLTFDPNVQPEQLAKLDTALTAITRVRDNVFLNDVAKRDQLLRIENLSGLSRRSVDTILLLSGERWPEVADEARRVLGEEMHESIAPDGVPAVQGGIDQRISPELDADEALLVAELVRPLILPTLVVDEERTREAREAARQNVEPVQQGIAEHQVIIERGQPIDATSIEILRQLGLLSTRVEGDTTLAVALLSLLAAAILAWYLLAFQPEAVTSGRNLLFLALIIALPVLVAKVYFSLVLTDESRRFLAYFLPLAAAPMLVAGLLAARLALVIGLVQAAFMTFAVVYQPDLSLVATVGPLDALRVLLVYGFGAAVGVYAVQRAERLNQYVLGGILVSAVALAVLFATWLLDPERRAFDVVWMLAAAAVNGVGSGLVTAGAFVAVGALFGVTTRLQLMELSQLNAPLLRRLQDEAPGTFHHSVIVGNLAERAADLVGADALLVRVGCYYHDIGKVLQPGFYIENQLGGDNPHDGMDPQASARIIAQHVRAGLDLARRHGLPPRVQAFIPEHHGTRLIAYFYRQASQRDPNVDPEPFRYPGPRPQSRETGLVMLADSTEAMVRASDDRSPERIDQIVEEVIAERLAEGELDDCDLTLRDLRTIAASFKQTLRGVYHPRIEYPEPTAAERQALLARFRLGRRPEPPAPAPAASKGQGPPW